LPNRQLRSDQLETLKKKINHIIYSGDNESAVLVDAIYSDLLTIFNDQQESENIDKSSDDDFELLLKEALSLCEELCPISS
jgi:hypothetical protein